LIKLEYIKKLTGLAANFYISTRLFFLPFVLWL
jgi:hypothetical protein